MMTFNHLPAVAQLRVERVKFFAGQGRHAALTGFAFAFGQVAGCVTHGLSSVAVSASFSRFSVSLRHRAARKLPRIQCMIAEMAQGVAVEGVKCFTASALPRPLFCMPTSMAMVRRMRSSNPSTRGIPYPRAKAPVCMSVTAMRRIPPTSRISAER